MPFCPKCRDEFQEWAKTCPDCQVDLVAELQAPPEPTQQFRGVRKHARAEPLVCVASARNWPTAQLWAGMLEDKGIYCVVKSYRGGGMGNSVTSGRSCDLPDLDIYVLQPDAERAREILNEVDPKG